MITPRIPIVRTNLGHMVTYDDARIESWKEQHCSLQCSKKFLNKATAFIIIIILPFDIITTFLGIRYLGNVENNPVLSTLLTNTSPMKAWYLLVSFKLLFCAWLVAAKNAGWFAKKRWYTILWFFIVVCSWLLFNNTYHLLLAAF